MKISNQKEDEFLKLVSQFIPDFREVKTSKTENVKGDF